MAYENLSETVYANRDIAKFFGGKALEGTKKQKEWGEKIRAEKLNQMDAEAAVMCCDPDGLLTHAKFWIENREKKADDIAGFVTEQKKLLGMYRSGSQDEAKAAAEKYNELTAAWGFL